MFGSAAPGRRLDEGQLGLVQRHDILSRPARLGLRPWWGHPVNAGRAPTQWPDPGAERRVRVGSEGILTEARSSVWREDGRVRATGVAGALLRAGERCATCFATISAAQSFSPATTLSRTRPSRGWTRRCAEASWCISTRRLREMCWAACTLLWPPKERLIAFPARCVRTNNDTSIGAAQRG